ncbi:MAG: cyanophycinase [Candidatus Aminicenantes bacterium]|jgi:cyanophycinase
MKRMMGFLLCFCLVFPFVISASPQGHLFIVGGGKRPEEMMKKFIALAEGFRSGKIIILPMASSVPEEVGPEQSLQLKNYGAKNVEFHILSREDAQNPESIKLFEDIGGIFFSGGVQSRLADVLLDTPVHKILIDLYKAGGVIGGTSAGAAVMSEIMITGDEKRKVEEDHAFETIEADNIVTARGFGLIKTAVIDQHFVRRKRHNRLISLVAENPGLLGIGIDESTAIIVNPDDTFDVIGERSVIVYDFSGAEIITFPDNGISAHNARMFILKQGDTFDLKAHKALSHRN